MILLLLVTLLLVFFSEFYYGFIFAPVGLYSLIWGGLFAVALPLYAEGMVSSSVINLFVISWVAFLVGVVVVTFFFGRAQVNSGGLVGREVDVRKIRKIGSIVAWAGFVFAIAYYIKSRQVLGPYLGGEELRHLWYSKSGELSAASPVTSWYGYNLGIATIMLSFFLNVTYAAIAPKVRTVSLVMVLAPSVLGIIVLSYAELSRARIADAVLISLSVYLFLKSVRINLRSLLLFARKEYLMFFVVLGLLSVASLITSSRNISAISEKHILNLFENTARYFEVSVVSVNTYLGAAYQEQIGLRAIIHPIYFLLERIKLIPAGPFPDPTILTEYVTYPTPTYLFWLYSSYGWIACIVVPFFLGVIATAVYILQRIRKTLFFTWALVCCYLVIILTYGGWRLSQLWFVILLPLLYISYRYVRRPIPLSHDA